MKVCYSATARQGLYTFLLCWFLISPHVSALVISEIHYNPLSEQDLEFIELTNDDPTPEDISGWSFVDGVRFTFPQGTVLRGGEVIVVCEARPGSEPRCAG